MVSDNQRILATMDIHFNYPQGDSSIYELGPDDTVKTLYHHAARTQNMRHNQFVVVYDGEHLLDMDVEVQDFIGISHEVQVEALCDDPLCVMSIRDEVEDGRRAIPVSLVAKGLRYTHEHHQECTRYLMVNPINLSLYSQVYLIVNIPDCFKTPDMCLEAVSSMDSVYKHVPVDLITPQIIDVVVKRMYDSTLRNLPQTHITQEICNAAFALSLNNIHYIPDHFKTRKMCDKLTEDRPFFISHIPLRLFTSKMAKGAVNYHAHCIENIPLEYITQDICYTVLEKNPRYINRIPEIFITQKMCNHVMHYVPQDVLNALNAQHCSAEYLHNLMVPARRELLDDIPSEYVTSKMRKLTTFVAHSRTHGRPSRTKPGKAMRSKAMQYDAEQSDDEGEYWRDHIFLIPESRPQMVKLVVFPRL